MEQKKRYELIDAIRGLAMVNMVIFHFLYDLLVIYEYDPGWYHRPASHFWQQGICWTFILISGFAWRFGKRNCIRRGILLNLWGLVITAVTGLAVPGQQAVFGILNLLGCAILLMALLNRMMSRIPPLAGFAGSIICFFCLRYISQGILGIGALSWSFSTVDSYGSMLTAILPTILGLPDQTFVSSDYFPLFPWFFLFTAGYFLYPILMRWEQVRRILSVRIPLLSVWGRYSIWVYLLHQPVCMGICMILMGGY